MGNPTQLNKDISSKEKNNNYGMYQLPIAFLSFPKPLSFGGRGGAAAGNGKEAGAKSQSAMRFISEIIMDNIEYELLFRRVKGTDREKRVQRGVEALLVETVLQRPQDYSAGMITRQSW